MEITSFVPGLNTVGKISSFISNKIRKRIADNNDLQSIKDRIIKEVVSSELKIVAIIDDIDRLNDEEIRAVFQLVKSLADFPNMMYFLSFDLDTVTHALNSVQDGNGLKFLEKIVQMPFELPEIKGNKVHEYLFSKLDSVLEEDYIQMCIRDSNKSYQRLKGQDVITSPKTKKSNRTIKMPKFLWSIPP